MYESLVNYIQRHSSQPILQKDIELIKTIFKPAKIRKKEYFLREGEICKYSAFIVKGAMRQYSTDDKGIEHIVSLYLEDWWATDRESFTMQTPSVFTIDALEDCDALLISKSDTLKMMEVPAFHETLRILDDKHAVSTQQRINAFISQLAEQRYAEFVNKYPEFLNRFPQHMIASYLGITRETLSRIRGQMTKK